MSLLREKVMDPLLLSLLHFHTKPFFFFFLPWLKKNPSSFYIQAQENHPLGIYFDPTVHSWRDSDKITASKTPSPFLSWTSAQMKSSVPSKLKLPPWLGFVFVELAASSVFLAASSPFQPSAFTLEGHGRYGFSGWAMWLIHGEVLMWPRLEFE